MKKRTLIGDTSDYCMGDGKCGISIVSLWDNKSFAILKSKKSIKL